MNDAKSATPTLARRDVLRIGALLFSLPALSAACKPKIVAKLGELELSHVMISTQAFKKLAKAARREGHGDPTRVASIEAGSIEDIREILLNRIEDDAQEGRLASLDGWMLTQTEIDVIRLAFPDA